MKRTSQITIGMTLMGTLLLSACNHANSASDSTDKTNSTQNTQTTNIQNNDTIAQALRKNLANSNIDLTVLSVTPTAMPNIYLVNLENLPPIFTDGQGEHIIQGDIVQIGKAEPIDISQVAMASIAKQALADVPTHEMIVFPAKGKAKASIYAFTDPTCHYCQLLHKDIDKINAAGIEVRYLAWPRGDQIKPLSTAIWCSADRQTALTQAKKGNMPPMISCDNPVEKHMALGYRLGVSGTPAIFTEDGRQIGGYLPLDDLKEVVLK